MRTVRIINGLMWENYTVRNGRSSIIIYLYVGSCCRGELQEMNNTWQKKMYIGKLDRGFIVLYLVL